MISLLSASSAPYQTKGVGRKSSQVSTRLSKQFNMGKGRTAKKIVSENRLSNGKKPNVLETKSSLVKKPNVSKTASKVKNNLDLNAKKKTTVKPKVQMTIPLPMKKDNNALKSTLSKKEPTKNVETVRLFPNKQENKNSQAKEKIFSESSEFKRKFTSILQKTGNESKIVTYPQNKSNATSEKAKKKSISESKPNERSSLHIETWGAVQVPKPLFNLSKALMQKTKPEKPIQTEKIFPVPETVIKHLNKKMDSGKPLEKPNVRKIWKF